MYRSIILLIGLLFCLICDLTVLHSDPNDPLSVLTSSNKVPGLLESDPLTPDQAFQFTATVQNSEQLRLIWTIANGTYLYKSRIHISLENSPGMELGPILMPQGVLKANGLQPDGNIGPVEVYHDNIDMQVAIIRNNPQATAVTLVVKYQGCAERGICYPPITQRINLDLSDVRSSTTGIPDMMAANSPVLPPQSLATQDVLANKLQHSSIWGIVATFFGLGLLLAFTPCILPMIPILSSIIVGQGHKITAVRGLVLSLAYVLAMAAAYTTAGVLAGLFGNNLQASFQNPLIIVAFALVFVALALSMFGLYELQIPTFVQTQASNLSSKQRGGAVS